MKKCVGLFCAAVFLNVAFCVADEPTVKLPALVTGEPGDFISVKSESNGKAIRWFTADSALKLFPTDLLRDTKTAVVIGKTPGEYRLYAYTALADVPSEPASVRVVINGPAPPPVPPTPPGPVPPTPGPAPIAGDGLRVLIVYETQEIGKLTPGQFQTVFGEPMRTMLDSKCVVGPDNKTREWRIYDKDISTTNVPKNWQDAMKRDRKSVPWLIVSNPQKGGGFEGPLPERVEDTIALLNKFGE